MNILTDTNPTMEYIVRLKARIAEMSELLLMANTTISALRADIVNEREKNNGS